MLRSVAQQDAVLNSNNTAAGELHVIPLIQEPSGTRFRTKGDKNGSSEQHRL